MTEETRRLLEACLHAFNAIPNKSLRLKAEGFPNTYALAAAIEKHLKESKPA